MLYPGCVFNRLIVLLFFATVFAVLGCQRERSFEPLASGTGMESGDKAGSGTIIESGDEETSSTGNVSEIGNGNATENGNGSGHGIISGTSKFILVPEGGHCSDAVVHGSYTDKLPLTLSDFVVLTVEVIAPGTWAYTTSAVKGFKFANSGNFTSTGKQQIILIAIGSPNSTGIAEFPLSIGTAVCSFKVVIKAPGGMGTGAQGEYYYKAIIGGVNYFEVVTDPGDFEAGSGIAGVDVVSFNAAIFHTADPMPSGVTAIGITKGMMAGYTKSNDAQFKAFFAAGTYPYSFSGDKNGIDIGWRDKQGRSWHSLHHSLRQPATSNFRIISVEDSPDLRGAYYIKVRMQFNCILFRDNSNEQVELTNGEFVGLFGKI